MGDVAPAAASGVDLSVVIVSHNSRDDIGGCLDSLPAALDGVRAEIAVVDNGSSDGTAAFVAAAYGHVLLLTLAENRGFAAGANAGLACTTGRFVLWLNPDARWIHGSMRDVLAWMDAHPDAGIAGLRLRNPGGSVQRSARTFPSYRSVLGAQHSLLTRVFPSNPFSREYLRGDLSYQEVARVDWVSGACLLHRRDVSQAIGGLDEGFFMYFEDVDFCDRATAAGWSVYFHPGATFEHRIGASSSPVRFRMLIARHRSMWRWYTKHFHRMALKDGAVWCGIWIRCGLMMLGQLWRRV